MVRRSKSTTSTSIIPPKSLPCVWMAAGLLAYKLCDRAYDCEHCPLDEALRGAAAPADHEPSQPASAPEPGPEPEVTCDFPDDRRYHPGHVWVQQIEADRARCGIDSFAAWLLKPIQSVVLPTPPTRLTRGGIACWLGDGTALVPLRAPVDGILLDVHLDVQGHPEQVTTSPYTSGWLLDVRHEGELSRKPHLLSASEHRERTRKQMARLDRVVARGLHTEADVGATLADGGERITDFRRQMGEHRFRKLIGWVFGQARA